MNKKSQKDKTKALLYILDNLKVDYPHKNLDKEHVSYINIYMS